MSTGEKTLTIKEFAKKIGYSREHVSRLIAKGVLKVRRTQTGRKYFTEEDVALFWGKDK